MAEPIRNGDGEKKQDCGHEAGKRWLLARGQEYKRLKAALLGDDLYSDQPFCMPVLQAGMSFLFTCKPGSHPWLSETAGNSFLESKEVKKRNGRYNEAGTYRRMNGVPFRDSKDALMMNYIYLQVRSGKTVELVYTNSWVTNKEVRGDNAEALAKYARARWKIENEHNNVLKNRGYNLEHNVETKFPAGMEKTTPRKYSFC